MNILDIVKQLDKELPHFPDGRIDYTNAKVAPVMTIFVKYQDKILLLKRSNQVGSYKGKWNAVGGYIDEIKPIRDKILEEIQEELGINKDNVKSIKQGEIFEFTDKEIDRTWIDIPCLVELKKLPNITLDWEHTDYRWIDPKEITDYDIVFKLDEVFKKI